MNSWKPEWCKFPRLSGLQTKTDEEMDLMNEKWNEFEHTMHTSQLIVPGSEQ